MEVKPTVALVGRPNVGKSELFNRIMGERLSIVDDTPGVTRDRVYGETSWKGKPFHLIDTGGIFSEQGDIIEQVLMQSQLAIEEADVIVFVVDSRDGITTADEEIALTLRKSNKAIILAANKSEGNYSTEAYDFYQLGFEEVISISAIHGQNTGDLLEKVVDELPDVSISDEEVFLESTKVSVIGKPNVGKSSLINSILNQERVIVSDIPGTTRDAIDTHITINNQNYTFTDTAGLRKKSKIEEQLEKYSVFRSLKGLERSEVALLLIDAVSGITEQDKKIASLAEEKGKGLIIVINKWDALEKKDKLGDEYIEFIRAELPSVNYAPILFVSAHTGKGIEKVFQMIDVVAINHEKRIATSDLNRVIEIAVARTPPPSKKGKQLKILYATQIKTKPPTIVLFINDRHLIKNTYKRYIKNQLRRQYDFTGTPIHLIDRER